MSTNPTATTATHEPTKLEAPERSEAFLRGAKALQQIHQQNVFTRNDVVRLLTGLLTTVQFHLDPDIIGVDYNVNRSLNCDILTVNVTVLDEASGDIIDHIYTVNTANPRQTSHAQHRTEDVIIPEIPVPDENGVMVAQDFLLSLLQAAGLPVDDHDLEPEEEPTEPAAEEDGAPIEAATVLDNGDVLSFQPNSEPELIPLDSGGIPLADTYDTDDDPDDYEAFADPDDSHLEENDRAASIIEDLSAAAEEALELADNMRLRVHGAD